MTRLERVLGRRKKRIPSYRIQMRCTDMRRGNRLIVSNTDELVVVTMKAESRKNQPYKQLVTNHDKQTNKQTNTSSVGLPVAVQIYAAHQCINRHWRK